MELKKLNNKIYYCEFIPSNMKKIVIYCHGFGENKERIIEHKDILISNNIGIIGFDFPCHGDDLSNDNSFNLTNSINYLNEIIKFAKKYNVPIILMGASFGGYVILSRINKINEKFDKIFLKYPAVNFYECTKRRLKIDLNYFDNNEYYEFLNGKKLYKESFIEFMNDDLMKNFNVHDNKIYILHGNKDETVLLTDIEKFCKKNNIKLMIVDGAKHGMKNNLDIVNHELLGYLNEDNN